MANPISKGNSQQILLSEMSIHGSKYGTYINLESCHKKQGVGNTDGEWGRRSPQTMTQRCLCTERKFRVMSPVQHFNRPFGYLPGFRNRCVAPNNFPGEALSY